MTLHTVSVIMLATGLRPNKDACLRFYPEHGFALIFDKRVEDPRVRPIPLAQLVCTQILLYRAHLAALSITPEIALTQAFRHKARRGKLPFFLLASDGTTSLRGIVSCWQRALKGNFGRDLPANLQRHFLRAELVGKASTETIDAFFGHWIVGTEPWGRYSALDPMVYRTDIGPAVDRALQQMGWREERGLGNGKASGVIGAKIEIGESLVDRPIKLGKKLRSEPSPFNNLLVQTLHSKLTRVTPDPLAPAGPLYAAQLGQILASAITNGALLDKNWFKPFLEALPNVPIRKERLWIDMEPADPGDTKHVYAYPRRWFCDPITEILIRRWRAVERQSGRITVQHSPEECLAAHLAGGSAEKKGHILDRFLEEAQVRWRFRMPGILVSYAVGEGPSLSLPGTTWERATYGRRIRAEKPPKPEWGKPERSKYTFFGERTPRSSALIKALKSDAAFSSFLQGYKGDGSLFAHVVRWAELAVHVKGGRRAGLRSWGQKARYKISTICTYADNVCKVLDDYSHAPMESLNADDLDNIYWCQLHTLSQESNPNTAINAINSFHSYLLDIFPEFYIGDNYDEFRTEGRVSLNMISSADYVRALDQLPGEGRKARILRLVLILGFRTGLRLPEILGLRHSDIAEAVDSLSDRKLMELYLRPYDTFTLKTSHSRRMLPLDGLLPPQELEELRRWQTDHYEEARDRPNGLLFTSAGGGQGKAHAATVRKQIIEALVRATGDEGMRFEHLRHSFATQLLACLLLPREGSVLPLPRGLDADSISGQRRDQIIARISGHERPGRSALHIVSQLCGHGPVTTTLRWYTHMLDWSVGAFTNRRNIEPQIPASSVLGTVNMLGEIHTLEAVKRADYRYRLNYPLVEPSSATSSEYQLPSAQEKVRPTNGHVNLMSAFPLLLRKFGSPSQKPALTGDAKLLRKLRPLPYTKLPDTSPGWTNVHTAVMGLRNGIDLVALSEGLGVSPEKIRRWLYMADLLAGPRRQGEKHMRFEPKMAAKARERFNVDAWKQAFPRMPSDTSSRDLVDQIWSKACLVMEDPDVPWALREFCRYYSVDTGYTSLLKKKDALRFYRGMALMGFANDLSVWPLWKKQRQILKGVPRECEQLRWRLAGGLAKGLRPKAPKVPEPATGRFPRSVAIQIGVPAFPGASETFKTNNHFRYAVRFALTMLAIANLDDIIEPKLRGGWRPGYGGYF